MRCPRRDAGAKPRRCLSGIALTHSPTSRPSELYHERQSLLLCGVHAVNNVLQELAFSKQDFEAIAKAQVRQQQKEIGATNVSRLSSQFGVGNFDQQVLESALLMYGYEMVRSSVGDVGLFGRADIGKHVLVECSPEGLTSPPIIRCSLPCHSRYPSEDGLSEAGAGSQQEIRIRVQWLGEQASLTSCNLQQILPTELRHPERSEAEAQSDETDACEDWLVVQRRFLNLVVEDYQCRDGSRSGDNDIRGQITLSNGWTFRNPLDLWSPLGFIRRVERRYAFGLVSGGHWTAIRKHPDCVLERGLVNANATDFPRLSHGPVFFDLDSWHPSPLQLVDFCTGGCTGKLDKQHSACECTVYGKLCDLKAEDASNVFVVRKLRLAD